ncbi:MAG: hybrid sensor histidine kinase/response regulator, partial [Alphaproteobacteria bacterium]
MLVYDLSSRDALYQMPVAARQFDQRDFERFVPQSWKVLIVDDDEDVHSITRLALSRFRFADRPLEFHSAFSASEAESILQANDDTAVMFVDVVMETNKAGLDFVQFVRQSLGNDDVRIILRTGQPGEAPEENVVRDYDINDYREKTELSARKLTTVMYAALRSYERIVTLRHAEERAHAASAAKSRFLSHLSHEFRTPLNAIGGLAQIMYDEMYRPIVNPKYKEYSWDIKISSEALLANVEQVLKIAEETSDSPPPLKETTFDLATLISECLKELSFPANENDAIRKRNLIVHADRQAVGKMIVNLISNALKFESPESDIRITVRDSADGELSIGIVDRGPGMSPEMIKSLGDPFAIEGSAYITGNRGVGLGLQITKHLIERHGGRLEIESSLGKGTTA